MRRIICCLVAFVAACEFEQPLGVSLVAQINSEESEQADFVCNEGDEEQFLYDVKVEDAQDSIVIEVPAHEEIAVSLVVRGENELKRLSMVATTSEGRAVVVIGKRDLFGRNNRGLLVVSALGSESRLNAKTITLRFEGNRLFAHAPKSTDNEEAIFNEEERQIDGADGDSEK